MADMHRVFDTGYFSQCTPRAEETRDGIKLALEVRLAAHCTVAWLAADGWGLAAGGEWAAPDCCGAG